jgi:hypothetical protein
VSAIAQAMAPKTGRPDHGHPQIEFDIDLAFSDVRATAQNQQAKNPTLCGLEPDVSTQRPVSNQRGVLNSEGPVLRG